MAISGAGTPEPGTSAIDQDAAPDEGQAVDWEARARELETKANSYDELRPRWTQDSQRLSEYEQLFSAIQDPETQAEALASLGFEMDTGAQPGEDVDTSEWDDPLEKEIQGLKATVEELRSQRELEASQREEQELISLRDDYIGDAISYIEQETGRKFSEKAEKRLGNLAIAMEREDGVPDVQGAYNELYGKEGLVEEERSSWIQARQGVPQAPGGRTAPAVKKPTTPRERAQYFDERLSQMEYEQ